MCGIIGYVGNRQGIQLGIDALRTLEYRGYDSAGIAGYDEATGNVFCERAVGKIRALEEKCAVHEHAGTAFILHTRWATHGAPTETNCHPHTDCSGGFFVAHNGIIENYRELKDTLISEGHVFSSETDTEVLPHLIERFFQGNLEEAVRKTLALVRGSYGIAVISPRDPGKIVAARLSSPLIVSVNELGGFVASDPSAILAFSKSAIFLNDGEVATISPKTVSVTDLQNGKREKNHSQLDGTLAKSQKGGHPHFMVKEMFEQLEAIVNALRGRLVPGIGEVILGGMETIQERLETINRVVIVGCGTSYYAGLVGKSLIEELSHIPASVEIASEFRYQNPMVDEKTAVICISQSGETADTLAALREAKRKGAVTIGIINVIGSSIAREVDAGVYNHAGPEIGVASTKAFTSQITVLALLALFLGRQRGMGDSAFQEISQELSRLPHLVEQTMRLRDEIRRIATAYRHADHMFFLGRKCQYPVALEGALKLKEISYIHAEGYGAGEMKHGPLALIDETFPTVAIILQDSVYEKMFSNIQEIRARKGPVIAIATEGDKEVKHLTHNVIMVPRVRELLSPVVSVIPLQFLAYEMALLRGHDPDYPRNLAKSVTVE